MPLKLLYFGSDDNFGLCPSYIRAAKNLHCELELFDYEKEFQKHVRFGKIGKLVSTYINIEAWIHKTNRKFVVKAKNYKPDIIFVFTNYHITTGAILFLKSILPNTKLVLIWPDSLANVKGHVITSAPLYDAVATLSKNSVEPLQALGFKKALWVPLAGDPQIHHSDITSDFLYDIAFVGGWRPEREKAMELIAENYTEKKIVIHGPDWKRFCKNKLLLPYCSGKPLFGKEMADCFKKSRININVIDDTNYPAANMRFFEVPTAGGLEVVSSCPEMEHVFKHKETLLYFHDHNALLENIKYVFDNPKEVMQMRRNAQQLIRFEHNYDLRLKFILSFFKYL